MDILLGLLLIAFCLAVYFLPVILAANRQLASGTAILVLLNLSIGWTVVGWLVCLLWAALGQTRDQARFYRQSARD